MSRRDTILLEVAGAVAALALLVALFCVISR
jgi:hypothetical protein